MNIVDHICMTEHTAFFPIFPNISFNCSSDHLCPIQSDLWIVNLNLRFFFTYNSQISPRWNSVIIQQLSIVESFSWLIVNDGDSLNICIPKSNRGYLRAVKTWNRNVASESEILLKVFLYTISVRYIWVFSMRERKSTHICCNCYFKAMFENFNV